MSSGQPHRILRWQHSMLSTSLKPLRDCTKCSWGQSMLHRRSSTSMLSSTRQVTNARLTPLRRLCNPKAMLGTVPKQSEVTPIVAPSLFSGLCNRVIVHVLGKALNAPRSNRVVEAQSMNSTARLLLQKPQILPLMYPRPSWWSPTRIEAQLIGSWYTPRTLTVSPTCSAPLGLLTSLARHHL
jgi:hypothetical protein